MQEDDNQANWQFNPELNDPERFIGEDMATSNGIPLPEIQPVSWTASEYISHEKTPVWYMMLFGVAGLLTFIVFLVTRDFLASFATLFAGAAMSVYAGRKPATKTYVLDKDGVHINSEFYPYTNFRSFSIVEEGAIDSIWLKPLKRLSPVVVMYFAPQEEGNIVNVISNFLPHEQRELDAIDRFSKRIRF